MNTIIDIIQISWNRLYFLLFEISNKKELGSKEIMNKDLTVGKPESVLFRFCMPLFGSILFQQLYNIADSFVAGKFIGENALAAVGNSYEITLIFIAFAFGCNMGCSIVVSKFFGAKQYEKMKTAITTACLFGLSVCAALMVFGLFGCDTLLHLIRTPMEVFADSKLYLDIYIWSLPFVFFYNIATGIFSALGDSKTPFYFLAVSSTTNILMDIWFVKGFQMGLSGVAWATFLCQGASCILAMCVVARRVRAMKTEGSLKVFDFDILQMIVKIAVPSTLQQSFISIGNIVIQGAINGFGPAVMAGYSASVKLNNLVITSFTTLGNGISNFTAQNLGAQEHDRIAAGFKAGLKLVWLLSLPLALLYFTCGSYLMRLFVDDLTEMAMRSGTIFLRILSPFYFVVSTKLVADGVLRGSGRMKQFMAATFTDLILRVVLALTLSRTGLGSTGIWLAWPIGWCVATTISVFFYRDMIQQSHIE